jgi:hypothetical protein
MSPRHSAEAAFDSLKTAIYLIGALFFLTVPLATVYGLVWLVRQFWRHF